MRRPPKGRNVGVVHGAWGEERAVEYLRAQGYVIVERNVRPCAWDARLEIDIIAYQKEIDTLVFVEVKQHKAHEERQRRLRSITRKKKDLLRRAFRAWLLKNRWHGNYRFDVIEVYGTPESCGQAEIDHVERVRIFVKGERYVNWKD